MQSMSRQMEQQQKKKTRKRSGKSYGQILQMETKWRRRDEQSNIEQESTTVLS